jgi:phage/plasmid primase-like uncharacterized protein
MIFQVSDGLDLLQIPCLTNNHSPIGAATEEHRAIGVQQKTLNAKDRQSETDQEKMISESAREARREIERRKEQW